MLEYHVDLRINEEFVEFIELLDVKQEDNAKIRSLYYYCPLIRILRTVLKRKLYTFKKLDKIVEFFSRELESDITELHQK